MNAVKEYHQISDWLDRGECVRYTALSTIKKGGCLITHIIFQIDTNLQSLWEIGWTISLISQMINFVNLFNLYDNP